MRVALHNLPPELEPGLATVLSSAGHEIASGDDIDALVAGTGALPLGTAALDVSGEDWAGMVSEIASAFRAARDLAARLVAHGKTGRIIFVADPVTLRPLEGGLLGGVAGGFLTTLAEVAAAELGGKGITANMLIAGWSDRAPAALGEETPVGRAATAEDVGAGCLFLLSEQAGYVNGITLPVDGGYAITKAPGGPNPLVADGK